MLIKEQNSAQQLLRDLLSVSLYRGVLERPAASIIMKLLRACVSGNKDDIYDAWGQLCVILSKDGKFRSLQAATSEEILADDNIFVKQLILNAADITKPIMDIAKRDLYILYTAASKSAELVLGFLDEEEVKSLVQLPNDPALPPLEKPWYTCIDELSAYHKKHGVGRFTEGNAFLWLGGNMHAVNHPDSIRLADLKSYETQRRIAIDNTLAFLDGFEANNMLLYGDRGTGKSSTVKALLNEYADRGLRMIEMPKEELRALPELTAQLASIPMKFIIFIDDLSFSGSDDNFAALKAVLEGGLSARPDNVLIYATSNRRHLLRETFSDRNGDEVHSADTIQEAVSLSDRFGIFLTFLMPDKQHFIHIIEEMAADRRLNIDRQALVNAAERWALERGARSPRYARQFIADAQSRLSRGESL